MNRTGADQRRAARVAHPTPTTSARSSRAAPASAAWRCEDHAEFEEEGSAATSTSAAMAIGRRPHEPQRGGGEPPARSRRRATAPPGVVGDRPGDGTDQRDRERGQAGRQPTPRSGDGIGGDRLGEIGGENERGDQGRVGGIAPVVQRPGNKRPGRGARTFGGERSETSSRGRERHGWSNAFPDFVNAYPHLSLPAGEGIFAPFRWRRVGAVIGNCGGDFIRSGILASAGRLRQRASAGSPPRPGPAR